MVIEDHKEQQWGSPTLCSPSMNGFMTPEKPNAAECAGIRGRCYQTTKVKVRNEEIQQDRFATPPRRPTRPTSEQMEFFLRE